MGTSRLEDAEMLEHADLVLTTYSTLVKDHQNRRLLYQLQWFRVILDEAHWIRNQATQKFHAVSSLHAQRRWCLTATPIQNKLEDLGALVQFLKIEPFDGASSKAAYQRYIIEPLSSRSQDACQNLRVLLQGICLRRANQGFMPAGTKYVLNALTMSLEERQRYNMILAQAKNDLEMRVNGTTNIQKYARLFTALTKLRGLCNFGSDDLHGDRNGDVPLVSDSADASCDLCGRSDSLDLLKEDDFCPVCSRPLTPRLEGDMADPRRVDTTSPWLLPPDAFSDPTSSSITQHRGSIKLRSVADDLRRSTYCSKRCYPIKLLNSILT